MMSWILYNWWLSIRWIQGLINPWNMIFTEASSWSQMSLHRLSHSLFISVWLSYIIELYTRNICHWTTNTYCKKTWLLSIPYFNLVYFITDLNYRNQCQPLFFNVSYITVCDDHHNFRLNQSRHVKYNYLKNMSCLLRILLLYCITCLESPI